MSKKVVVVSGASRGLGLEICKKLIAQGYFVIGFSRSKTEDTLELECRHKTDFRFYEFDLSNLSEINKFIINITKEHGHIFGLVNNAAVGVDGVLPTLHDNDIISSIEINITAQVLLTKYISRSMIRKKEGVILNISSVVASTGYSGLATYAFAKAGQVGFTKSLSRELGKVNIRVNAIQPGFMETDMTAKINEKHLNTIRKRSPFKQLVTTEQVANSVAFLLSERGSGITGQTLVVDMGAIS